MKISDIIFIGGDRRMIYAAQKLGRKYSCTVGTATDTCPAARYDAAVLPVSAGKDIPAALPALLKENAVVFAGKTSPELEALCSGKGWKLYSYLTREEFAVRNAVLTAEGAVGIAIRETGTSVSGSDVLVLGYGRIAKITARYFAALGADVTAAARKPSDLAWIEAAGHTPADINRSEQIIAALSEADIIINTVPAVIITGRKAEAIRKDAVLIELASAGCTDGTAKCRIIQAGGLPGRVAPVTAGYIIADTIENMLDERSLNYGGA